MHDALCGNEVRSHGEARRVESFYAVCFEVPVLVCSLLQHADQGCLLLGSSSWGIKLQELQELKLLVLKSPLRHLLLQMTRRLLRSLDMQPQHRRETARCPVCSTPFLLTTRMP
jgi:hypothetical protein